MVIDWTCGRRGVPLADVARTWVLLHMGQPPADTKGRWLIRFFATAYLGLHLRRYRQLRPFVGEELAAWKLPVVALRLARDWHNTLPEERRQMIDYIARALGRRASG